MDLTKNPNTFYDRRRKIVVTGNQSGRLGMAPKESHVWPSPLPTTI